MAERLAPGDIVVVRFPEHIPPGHEQHGAQPAVVLGLPEVLGEPRFPVVLVAPLTTDRGQLWAERSPALYSRLPAGAGGLPSASIVLLDQVRFLGLERVAAYLGTVRTDAYQPICHGLQRLLEPQDSFGDVR